METECDIVHNMCGWFIQFVSSNHSYSTQLKVTTELEACMAAHGMGFNRMAVWEYERHIKDVCIPKETLGKQEAQHNGNGHNGNGMHLRQREARQRSGMRVTRSSNGSCQVSA